MKKIKLFLSLVLIIFFAGCVQNKQIEEVKEINLTKIENNKFGFLIGAPMESEVIKYFGAGWARPHPGPFSWGRVEFNEEIYDFSETDEWVKNAQENEVMILATIWPYTDWDQMSCHSVACEVPSFDQFYPNNWKKGGGSIPKYRCIPCDFEKYQEFVKELVERYDGDGVNDMPGLILPIHYWEISNEPEMQDGDLNFFIGSEVEYVEILKNSHEAIKEVCENCQVVQGGAAGAGDKTWKFWRTVFENNGQDYFDITNIHIINFGDVETLNVKPFKELLDEFKINKPIWVTEAIVDPESNMPSSVEGAFNEGAEKIFFVGVPQPTSGKDSIKLYQNIINSDVT